MKKYSIYILVLLGFLFFVCGNDPNSITITGSITNPISDMVMFNYSDTSYQAKVNEDGGFAITFTQDSAQYVTFVHGERTRMFLRPGDNINVTFDTHGFDETMSYENSPESSFLAYKLISTEKKDFYGESLYLKDESEYQSYLDEHKLMLLQELDKFDDEKFKKAEIEDLNTSIDRYLKQKQNLSGRSKEELSYMWDARRLSMEYNFYGLLESSSEGEFAKKLIEYEKKMFASLETLKNTDGYDKEKEKIATIISKWKERKYDHENMPNDGDMSIDFSYPNEQDELVSLSSFRGRIVYVDVWATWCGPCIAEIPSLDRLQKDYADKNIVFLSVSVDTDKEAWTKMLTDDELGGVHLWANGWSQITRSYAIFGIPRFILIDETGNLISADAPRPSSGEIRTLIDNSI